MKWILKITIPIIFLLSCNSSSKPKDDVKTATNIESHDLSPISNDTTPNQHLTEFDNLYVGTWESEKITRDDDIKITDPDGKTYLRITKPNEYYRIELKSSKTNGYQELQNKFQKMSDFIIQIEETFSVQNILMLNEEKNKLKFESRPMWHGTQTKGTITIIYHKLR